MTGSVLQVNISRGGLPKLRIPVGVVGPLGIQGDHHDHPRFHGGPLKALLLICSEAIEALIAQGYPLFPGAMGENVTICGIDRRQMRGGQRYRLGEVVVELTTVRVPCNSLDVYGPAIKQAIYDRRVKAGDPGSPLWAMSGFYASVARGGIIRTGDPIALLDQSA